MSPVATVVRAGLDGRSGKTGRMCTDGIGMGLLTVFEDEYSSDNDNEESDADDGDGSTHLFLFLFGLLLCGDDGESLSLCLRGGIAVEVELSEYAGCSAEDSADKSDIVIGVPVVVVVAIGLCFVVEFGIEEAAQFGEGVVIELPQMVDVLQGDVLVIGVDTGGVEIFSYSVLVFLDTLCEFLEDCCFIEIDFHCVKE